MKRLFFIFCLAMAPATWAQSPLVTQVKIESTAKASTPQDPWWETHRGPYLGALAFNGVFMGAVGSVLDAGARLHLRSLKTTNTGIAMEESIHNEMTKIKPATALTPSAQDLLERKSYILGLQAGKKINRRKAILFGGSAALAYAFSAAEFGVLIYDGFRLSPGDETAISPRIHKPLPSAEGIQIQKQIQGQSNPGKK